MDKSTLYLDEMTIALAREVLCIPERCDKTCVLDFATITKDTPLRM